MPNRTPGLLLVGSMKSGTSSLAYLLNQHPDLYFSDPKEPEILLDSASVDEVRERYDTLFARSDDSALRAEGSTAYTKHGLSERSAHMAAEALGRELRIVALLRDPVERLESHIRHELNKGLEEHRVTRLLREDPIFVGTSRYADQLEPWIRRFGRERVLVLTFAAFRADPDGVCRRVCEFCNLPPIPASALHVRNTNPSNQRLRLSSPLLRIARSPLYRHHIRPRLPRRLIERAVGSVAQVSTGSQYQLMGEDRRWAERQLAHVEADLRVLLDDPEFTVWKKNPGTDSSPAEPSARQAEVA